MPECSQGRVAGFSKRLGANALVLDDRTVIMDTQHQRIIDEVGKRNHKVIEVPYGEAASGKPFFPGFGT